MKIMYVYVLLVGMSLIGCLGVEDGHDSQAGLVDDELVALLSRPSLSSICGFACHNSHGEFQCADQRVSGQANVAIAPLLEGTTKVASTIWGTTSGWASTSCPSCQWQLQGVTTGFLIGGTAPSVSGPAIDDIAVFKTMNHAPAYEWDGTVSLLIWDPTDTSVGTCTLNVDVTLTGG